MNKPTTFDVPLPSLPTSLKQGDGFLSCSSIAHFTVACRMLASYSHELAVPDGVPRERSYPGSLK